MDVDELRPHLPVRRARRRAARRPARDRRRGAASTTGDVLFRRGRTGRLLVGAARRARRAGPPRRHGRRPWSRVDGTARACGRAGSRPGTTRAATWPPAAPRPPAGCSGSRPTASGSGLAPWFPFGVHLIEGFFQTVRNIESLARQREALVALGTLAAGLAHEINNPAAAAARAVDALGETCDALLALARAAGRALAHRRAVRRARRAAPRDRPSRSADAIRRPSPTARTSSPTGSTRTTSSDAWRIAPTLAAAGVDVEWCERAARRPRRRHARRPGSSGSRARCRARRCSPR